MAYYSLCVHTHRPNRNCGCLRFYYFGFAHSTTCTCCTYFLKIGLHVRSVTHMFMVTVARCVWSNVFKCVCMLVFSGQTTVVYAWCINNVIRSASATLTCNVAV